MKDRTRTLLTSAFSVYAVSTLISMAVMSIGAAFLAAAFAYALVDPASREPVLAHALRSEPTRPFSRQYLWVSIALVSACALSLIMAMIAPLSFGGHSSQVRFFREIGKLWYFAWPLILVAGLRVISEKQRATVLKSWLAAFFVLSVIGVLQHWIGWPRPQPIPGTDHRYHTTLFLGHHLSVASIFIFPYFASLDWTWRAFRGEKPLRIPLGAWLCIAATGTAALFFTESRMLWLALPVGVLLWLALSLPKRWSFALIAFVAAAGLAGSQLPAVKARLTDRVGVATREDLWRANLTILRERPFTGAGWLHNHELAGYYLMDLHHTDDVFSGHAHDDFLEMLGGMGAIGAAAWVAWSLLALWIAWRSRKNRAALAFGTGLFCAWIVFQINGLTQVNFWEAKVSHQMMWAMAWALLWVSSPRERRSG